MFPVRHSVGKKPQERGQDEGMQVKVQSLDKAPSPSWNEIPSIIIYLDSMRSRLEDMHREMTENTSNLRGKEEAIEELKAKYDLLQETYEKETTQNNAAVENAEEIEKIRAETRAAIRAETRAEVAEELASEIRRLEEKVVSIENEARERMQETKRAYQEKEELVVRNITERMNEKLRLAEENFLLSQRQVQELQVQIASPVSPSTQGLEGQERKLEEQEQEIERLTSLLAQQENEIESLTSLLAQQERQLTSQETDAVQKDRQLHQQGEQLLRQGEETLCLTTLLTQNGQETQRLTSLLAQQGEQLRQQEQQMRQQEQQMRQQEQQMRQQGEQLRQQEQQMRQQEQELTISRNRMKTAENASKMAHDNVLTAKKEFEEEKVLLNERNKHSTRQLEAAYMAGEEAKKKILLLEQSFSLGKEQYEDLTRRYNSMLKEGTELFTNFECAKEEHAREHGALLKTFEDFRQSVETVNIVALKDENETLKTEVLTQNARVARLIKSADNHRNKSLYMRIIENVYKTVPGWDDIFALWKYEEGQNPRPLTYSEVRAMLAEEKVSWRDTDYWSQYLSISMLKALRKRSTHVDEEKGSASL
jgi:hypothetical protein